MCATPRQALVLFDIDGTLLRRAGPHHRQAFVELADDRAGLVCIALKEARRQGWINGTSPVALIGDHPNDINAARANSVRAIAVATGLASAEELAAHSPDILVPDLRALSMEMLIG